MNITFFGTAPANAFPGAFNSSAMTVFRPRAKGGRSLLKRSAALVDRSPSSVVAPHAHCWSHQAGSLGSDKWVRKNPLADFRP